MRRCAAADAARARSAGAAWARGSAPRRRRPPAADAQGARDPLPIVYGRRWPRPRSNPRCCWRAWRRRANHGDREGGQPRPHRTDAEAFWREIGSTREGSHGRKIALTGQPELAPAPIVVPADPSSAAFPIVAALIVQGSDIVLSDVMTNPLRTGLFTTLREMGASIEESRAARRRGRADGAIAGPRLETARRRGAAGARALDDRRISGAGGGGELCRRHHHHARFAGIAGQESDRLEATAAMLRVNGVKVEIGRRSDRRRQGSCAGRWPGRHPHGSSHRDVGAGDGACRRQARKSRRYRLYRHLISGFHPDDALAGGGVS